MTIRTDMTAYRLADEAIGLFLEYRDRHGYSEQDARSAAARDTEQGIDAEQELRAHGELPPLPDEPLPGPRPRDFGQVYPDGLQVLDKLEQMEQARGEAAADF
jgi:hypothetical protein